MNGEAVGVTVAMGLGLVGYGVHLGHMERRKLRASEYDRRYAPAVRGLLAILTSALGRYVIDEGLTKEDLMRLVISSESNPEEAGKLSEFLLMLFDKGLLGQKEQDRVLEYRKRMGSFYAEWNAALQRRIGREEFERWLSSIRRDDEDLFKLWLCLEQAAVVAEHMASPNFAEYDALIRHWSATKYKALIGA